MKRKATLLAIFAAISNFAFGAGYLEVRAPGYNYRSADYTTSHVFVDEVAGTAAPIEILFNISGYNNITDVEVYTNLNRRDRARADKNGGGCADGIVGINGAAVTDTPADTDPVSGH